MDYLGGFQYQDNVLRHFPTAEGYVKNTAVSGADRFNYVYNYTDHLGNVRVSYGQDPVTQAVRILEENNYYPFGLKHKNYNMSEKNYTKTNGGVTLDPVCENCAIPFKYNYKYDGKELQDELGLNVYDYGARLYDPALGRWMNIDPLAEQGRRWSPYAYAFDNPIYFVDPDGMWPDLPSWSSVKKSYNEAKSAVTRTYNETKSAVTRTYNEAKATVTRTYAQAKATVVVGTTVAIKGAERAQQEVKDNKQSILSVAKGMQDVGGAVTALGLVGAGVGAAVTGGPGAVPGLQVAEAGSAITLAGEVLEGATELITGDSAKATAVGTAVATAKIIDTTIDALVPGPVPNITEDVVNTMKGAVKEQIGNEVKKGVKETLQY